MEVELYSRKVFFLVDTGSSLSLISEDVFKSLPVNLVLEELDTSLTTADGDLLSVQGKTNVTLLFGSREFTTSVVVAKLGGLSGIIGLDFLVKYDVLIDASNGILHSHHFGEIPLLRENRLQNRCARIHLAETVSVPGGSEMFVQGKITDKFPPDIEALIEPDLDNRVGNRILMAKSVVNTNGLDVTFSVFNPTKETIILKKNAKVASLQTIDSVWDCEHTQYEEPRCKSADAQILPLHLRPLLDKVSSNLTEHQCQMLKSILIRYSDVFIEPEGSLGRTDLAKHTISTGDARPIKLPPRRLPIHQKKIAEEEIDKMLREDVIEPSNSPWAAPIVLVKKRDGTTRFCVDYRKLNSVTKKDAYPLPRIDESLDTLSGAKYFCTLDLASGYWQVVMDESDKQKTAFATHKGLFQFKVLPFGLSNSPATFERLMEAVLSGLQWERCLVYLDDIIIFGSTFEKTLESLTFIFDRLQSANLKLKPKKCTLFQEQVSFLGHIVSHDGIRCNPEKITAVQDWPTPTSVTEIRSFIGIASYYRRFIENFSNIAYPLTRLTQKDKKFEWSEDCENAFITLKHLLTTAPILSYPSTNDMFILDTDASAYGVGAVLSQLQDGKEVVIAYGSKTLSRSQMGYCTTYRELLAVVTFVKQFRHYLYGRPFLLRTDHASLIWLKNFKEPEGLLARWISLLETYDFTIEHRKGNLHGNADGLSRRPRKRCKRENCRQCSPGADCSVNTVTANIQPEVNSITRPGSNWLEQWSQESLRNQQDNDPPISRIKHLLLECTERPKVNDPNPTVNCLLRQWDRLSIIDNILYRKWEKDNKEVILQLVAPKSIRREIMYQLHNNRTSGHLGREKTMQSIKNRFYWPGMSDDIGRWCQSCQPCARKKPGPGIGKSPMQHVTVNGPLECIAIDIVGPLPMTSNDNQYIMVIGDYFSKWKEAFALSDHTAQTVADKLVTEFICRFGVPYRIHTDQGREFESELFSQICSLLGIAKSRTTPYHPQSDGMIERFNRTLQQMLAIFVDENRTNWDDHLPYLMMAYRATVHESTKCTPNLVMLGREIMLPIDIIAGTPPMQNPNIGCNHSYVEWVRNSMEMSFSTVHDNLMSSFKRQKRYYDTKLKPRAFSSGDLVWRWYPPKAQRKLGSGWTGPYAVLRKLSDITYEIQNSATGKTSIVHVDHLKELRGDGVSENQYISDSDFEAQTNQYDSDSLSDEESDSDDPQQAALGSQPIASSPSESPLTFKLSRKGRLIKPVSRYSP